MGASEPRLAGVDAAAPGERGGDGRTIGLVAVAADAHPHLGGKIDAVEVGEKAVDEMLARHLTVADDVDAGILLELQREDRRVALRIGEFFAVEPPFRPQFFRLCEPGRLRQTAGSCRFEHASPPSA